jgi:hypothetical protein
MYRLAHNGYGTGCFGFLLNVAISRHYYGRNANKHWVLASLGEKSAAIPASPGPKQSMLDEFGRR